MGCRTSVARGNVKVFYIFLVRQCVRNHKNEKLKNKIIITNSTPIEFSLIKKEKSLFANKKNRQTVTPRHTQVRENYFNESLWISVGFD